ncbi:type IV secretion system protein [Sphingomonas sp.]|uniref:type IV secretion system protein n=1 Tax=Sphingomonas sp. TaxID=28214 RepID=UPI003AFFCCAF
MNACPTLGADTAGIAPALRAIDCMTGQATATAFGRLFGAQGALMPALTILLTLYVAFFAIGLLTGRSRLGVSALTPRMMTLGLVLTFATSWAAYQNVVWQLATGAPDQLAGLVAGTHGSATQAFADRLDRLFGAVADAAQAAAKPAPATPTGITPAAATVGGFNASTVLWLAAIMLLLGTVGVMITAKIALAALLALGPVFVLFALFGGTRGLFEGWLKGVVLFALAPMLAVLLGGAAVIALMPVADAIALSGGEPDPRGVGVLFVGASVYVALMAMALKVATVLVAGWRLPGAGAARSEAAERTARAAAAAGIAATAAVSPSSGDRSQTDERVRGIVAGLGVSAPEPALVADDPRVRRSAQVIALSDHRPAGAAGGRPRSEANGLGSRFRTPPAGPNKGIVS